MKEDETSLLGLMKGKERKKVIREEKPAMIVQVNESRLENIDHHHNAR